MPDHDCAVIRWGCGVCVELGDAMTTTDAKRVRQCRKMLDRVGKRIHDICIKHELPSDAANQLASIVVDCKLTLAATDPKAK